MLNCDLIYWTNEKCKTNNTFCIAVKTNLTLKNLIIKNPIRISKRPTNYSKNSRARLHCERQLVINLCVEFRARLETQQKLNIQKLDSVKEVYYLLNIDNETRI